LERLTASNAHLFDRAFALYQAAFPVEERRDTAEQRRVMNKEDYHFDLIMSDGEFIGVMLYWETESLIFLEHFATLPEIRGMGHGKRALDLLKDKNKVILLEIEPPIDEITERRYNFYRRNGFAMNPYHHIQAKYHLGDDDLELKVLSYPRLLESDEYRGFYEYMTREIGIQPNESKEVVIRELRDGDDLDQIAILIYLTDPYVYPNWFDSMEDGIKVIRQMIHLPTLYNKENITVAVAPDGIIAGIIVSKQAPFTEDINHIREAFELAGVKIDSRTEFVFEAYYSKMGTDEDGYYIANVAVDDQYRKKGIATAMMNHILEGKEYCTLECVVANVGSWRLYQRLGFRIAYEYPGVHGIPCYKMYYKK
jgi:ribosomal protein S18 acetylase RimI-like enzyme